MLAQLSIKNLAVIEALDLSFEAGMSVITGETGAGKSIVLQALALALGKRSNANLVRHGKTFASISAVFDIRHRAKIQDLLTDQSLNDENECILRRVIYADGRSKAFINGISVPLSSLKKLGALLIDMHSQNEHQLLLQSAQQRELLDDFAGARDLCAELNEIVTQYQTFGKQIEQQRADQHFKIQQRDLLSHQLNTLIEAVLCETEILSIESDFKIQANAATLITQIGEILHQLDSETGINHQLLQLSNQLSQSQIIDDKLTGAQVLLTGAQLQTQETIYELTQYLSKLSIDETAAQELEARMSELYDLARKHDCQIPELLQVQRRIETELNALGDAQYSIDALQIKRAALQTTYAQKSAILSTKRQQQGRAFSASVTQIMQTLGMPNSEFVIALLPKSSADGVHFNGAEGVDFLVKTNAGQTPKPLKKIASGGELSRISLAISVIDTHNTRPPTLIFDEVDVGISGAVAEVVGQKLKQLASKYQVLCITHLAQVAALGHQHLLVAKTQHKANAQTQATYLSGKHRVAEIARILGGVAITDKTLDAAQEMIHAP